jgi:hypothetical protein
MENERVDFPYELLLVSSKGGEEGTECKHLLSSRWPSHIPLPCVGDCINDIRLDGIYVVKVRLVTKSGDEVVLVTLYVEQMSLALPLPGLRVVEKE